MGATQCRQPFDQFARHILFAGGRARGHRGQARSDGEQVFDAVTHFARKQLARFFCLFATGDVQKDPKHRSVHNAGVIPLAP